MDVGKCSDKVGPAIFKFQIDGRVWIAGKEWEEVKRGE